MDGKPPRGAQDLLSRVAQLQPGQATRLTWLRGPRSITVRLRVIERPRR